MKHRKPTLKITLARLVASSSIALFALSANAAPDGGPDPIDLPNPGQAHPAARAYEIVQQRVPTLSEFRLVKLNTEVIAQRVENQQPVRLPFAVHGASRMPSLVAQTVPHDLQLGPRPLIVAGTQGTLIYDFGPASRGDNQREEVQVQTVDLPASYSHQGPILGNVEGRGAYIVRNDMVLGLTLAPNPPLGNSGLSVIEPLDRLLRRNGATAAEVRRVTRNFNHVVYNSAALQGDIPIDIEDSVREAEESKSAHKSASRARVNEDISIYMIGDVEYTGSYASTGDAFNDQTWTLFGVEIITQLAEPGPNGNGEFDIDIDVTGQALWVAGGPSSTDPATLLEQSYNQFPWSVAPVPVNDIGLVHTFTGKNLDGNVIGKAWKIGGFDDACGTSYSTDPACKQSIAQPAFVGSTWLLEVILMAHEIGHNMDGVHGDCDINYCAGATCGRTVMCSGLGADQMLFYSELNAIEIADKVDAECAGDPC